MGLQGLMPGDDRVRVFDPRSFVDYCKTPCRADTG